MSPRDYILAAWAAVPALASIPLVDATNKEVDTGDLTSPWVGILVQAEPSRLVTLGSKPFGEETGTVLLGVFSASGTGIQVGEQTAYLIRDTFLEYQASDKQFEVRGVNGPMNLDPEADGQWFRMAVELEYGLWLKGQNP